MNYEKVKQMGMKVFKIEAANNTCNLSSPTEEVSNVLVQVSSKRLEK